MTLPTGGVALSLFGRRGARLLFVIQLCPYYRMEIQLSKDFHLT